MGNTNQIHPDFELNNLHLPQNVQIEQGGSLTFVDNDPRQKVRLSVVDLLSFPKTEARVSNTFDAEIVNLIKTITNQETINFAELEAAINDSLDFWNEFLDMPSFSNGARKATETIEKMLANNASSNKGDKEGIINQIKSYNRLLKSRTEGDQAAVKDSEIKALKAITDFVRQASAFDKKLIGPYICAFLKIVMAFAHLQKYFTEEDRIEKLTEKFEENIFSSIQNYEKVINGWKLREIRTSGGKKIKVSTTSRAKSFWRVAAKLLKAPENDYTNSIKDLIGVRLELQAEDFIDTFVTLSNEIRKKGGNLEKMRYRFDKKDETDINYHFFTDEEEIRNLRFPKTEAKQYDNFEDVRIVGTWQNENFEIQLIPFGHDNEIGVSHHKVHEEIGKLEVLFRLYGAIPVEWVQHGIKKAHDAASNDIAWRKSTINNGTSEIADGDMKTSKKVTRRAMRSAKIVLYNDIKDRFYKDLILIDNGRRVISKKELKNIGNLYGEKMPQKYQEIYNKTFGTTNLSSGAAG